MEEYFRFFEAGDAMFLLESLYVHAYKDLNCISFRRDGNVTVLFHHPDFARCERDAKELISSSRKFAEYFKSFDRFLCEAPVTCEKIVQARRCEKFVLQFLRLLSYYRWTESFYTDSLYTLPDPGPIQTQNLQILETLKHRGRVCLNAMVNSPDGFLFQLAKVCDEEQLLGSSVSELQSGIHFHIPLLRKENHLLKYDGQLLGSDASYYQTVAQWIDGGKKNLDGLIQGIGASAGIVQGMVWILSANFDTYGNLNRLIEEMPEGIILVSETTSPDIVGACQKASGIITNQGGLGSHAAIISRELGIPCVVGTGNATHILRNGDWVELNGQTGRILIHPKEKQPS